MIQQYIEYVPFDKELVENGKNYLVHHIARSDGTTVAKWDGEWEWFTPDVDGECIEPIELKYVLGIALVPLPKEVNNG